MKIKTKQDLSAPNLMDEKLKALSNAEQQIVERAASHFNQEIINEIYLSPLSEAQRHELINSLVVEKVSPSKWIIKINHNEVHSIEFGTRERTEIPFLLRAKIKAQANIKRIINQEFKRGKI